MALGLAGLLVILRFDAERFSAAEYDDVDRWGNPPSLLRRLAWYTLGHRRICWSCWRSIPVRRSTCSWGSATASGR